jgi:hypothetical protein
LPSLAPAWERTALALPPALLPSPNAPPKKKRSNEESKAVDALLSLLGNTAEGEKAAWGEAMGASLGLRAPGGGTWRDRAEGGEGGKEVGKAHMLMVGRMMQM